MESTLLTSVGSARADSSAWATNWRNDNQPVASHAPSPSVSASPRAIKASAQTANNELPQQPPPREIPIQEQQKASLYVVTPMRTENTDRPIEEKRRQEQSARRTPASYSLASYTGERANRTYLQVAAHKPGKVVDEMV